MTRSCVSTGARAMTLTDEKDHRAYTVTGDSAGLKPGDLGPCQP